MTPLDIAEPAIESPIDRHEEVVRAEWCRADGTMNPALYVMVLENAHPLFLDALGIDAAYRARTGCSTFALEGHLRYGAMVRAGERVRVASRMIANDAKRLHSFHRLRRADTGETVATYEVLALHVDLRARRAAPMPPELLAQVDAVTAAHARLPLPAEAGGCIRLDASRDDGAAVLACGDSRGNQPSFSSRSALCQS